ncbi:MAG TPA: DUF2076 domain-containing protein [Bryobacteraceae bacterium]|nr:DUF2076 domain-containing protein [Bryobacteraceae bacterium]
MTPDERDMLQELANKVAQTPAPPRDAEAEDFIRKSIGSRPDALYLMTQTVLIQNIALQRAQQQIQELQHASQTPVSTGSSFLGGASARPAGYSQPGNPQSQQQYSAPPPPPPPPQYAPPAQSVASPGGGGSSFLRGAAQTAAGVAGGVLAADAISSMFGHHGGGFGPFGGGGFLGGAAPTEEVINNYYETPGPQSPADDSGNYGDSGNYNDASADQDQSDDNAQYDDANYDSGDDGGFDDNSGNDFA